MGTTGRTATPASLGRVVDIGAPLAPSALRAALARALRDPDLELAFWLEERELFVDDDGRPVTVAAADGDRAVTSIVDTDGAVVAALVHGSEIADADVVVAGCTAAGPALATGDAERRRLERNLHDGAQQRLVSLSLELGLLEQRFRNDPEAQRAIDQARRELGESLQELRDLARGIHPAIVTGHGLAVALESLVARSPVPVALEVEMGERAPETVEVAAYYLVSESLTNVAKYACASRATVVVRWADAWLSVEIEDDGVGGADAAGGSGLRGLRDRIEALGGRIDVRSPTGGGTRVRAEIPCGS